LARAHSSPPTSSWCAYQRARASHPMIVHSSSAHCHLQACASALLHALCRRTPLPLNLTLSPACAAPEVHHRVCTSQQVSIHNECGIQILGGAVVERRRNRLIAQGGVPRLSSSDRDFHRGDTLRRLSTGSEALPCNCHFAMPSWLPSSPAFTGSTDARGQG
jgi:hypothetical protein